MQAILATLPEFVPGTVWLVGAGPGDRGLLTLLGLKAMLEADVIVYDALVSADLLALAPQATSRIYAGKRGGKPSAKQPDISLTLIRDAKAGKRVLRLKGGDPFVFGRGGEEAMALANAGIPFRIVPGITAGIGGLAYAGIPVTHRDCNSVVAFVTGHDASGEIPNQIDWDALAKASPVLVFYMAMKHLPVIANRLLQAGRAADEALAVIAQATMPDQKILVTNLGNCVQDLENTSIEPPAVIVLGNVVNLRPILDWAKFQGSSAIAR